ncbi:UNVERIFIED_CONTAM: hypothetical protein Sangu_1427300 [Sesamum angustifolium]|uniref:Uncharacterized protein n=1 Tax=Sesamum angustifolium TaxID=2727405 RepID=A0AAW2N6B5_9LAMI
MSEAYQLFLITVFLSPIQFLRHNTRLTPSNRELRHANNILTNLPSQDFTGLLTFQDSTLATHRCDSEGIDANGKEGNACETKKPPAIDTDHCKPAPVESSNSSMERKCGVSPTLEAVRDYKHLLPAHDGLPISPKPEHSAFQFQVKKMKNFPVSAFSSGKSRDQSHSKFDILALSAIILVRPPAGGSEGKTEHDKLETDKEQGDCIAYKAWPGLTAFSNCTLGDNLNCDITN